MNKTIQNSDKNLQDDWLPDMERKKGATSKELPEYGENFMQKDRVEDKGKPVPQPNTAWTKKEDL